MSSSSSIIKKTSSIIKKTSSIIKKHQQQLDLLKTIESGSKHLLMKRFTLRFPEQKLKFVGDGYQFDPKRGVGIAGSRGRHILFHEKCTGCQLCAITCEGIAEAIAMVKVNEKWKQNKKQ